MTGPQYLIVADFGRLGRAFVERDPVDMTLEATVRDLASRQWDNVVQVIEFDLSAGTCRDVTNIVDNPQSCG